MPKTYAISALVAMTILACTGLALAGGSIEARLESPVVIGDQLFPAGLLELRPTSSSELYAVRVNGKQIALIYSNELRRLHAYPIALIFKRDMAGRARLVGFESMSTDSRYHVRHGYTVATLAKGLETVPAYLPQRTVVIAQK